MVRIGPLRARVVAHFVFGNQAGREVEEEGGEGEGGEQGEEIQNLSLALVGLVLPPNRLQNHVKQEELE